MRLLPSITAPVIAAAITLFTSPAVSQTVPSDPPTESPPAPSLDDAGEKKEWALSASVTLYIVPDDQEYIQPTLTADHDWLHLEARYNYEALDTASFWLGYNFSGGKELTWAITPMLGGVVGEINGIAPGYEVTLNWRKFELYSEGEYVIDTDESSDSFFYSWSELTYSPVDWFNFGVVIQRTRLYQSDRDIQPGVLVGFSFENIDLTAYILDPDKDATLGFSFGVNF